MLRAACATVLLTLLSTSAHAQAPVDELRQAEEQLAAALTARDAAALDRLLAADFVMRAAPDVARDAWLTNALTLCWGDTFEISDFIVTRAAADRAVVSLLLTTHSDPATCEKATIRSLLTDVWVHEAAAWRLAVRHSGPAAAAVTARF